MRETEKKYRQLMETIHEGIWVIDKDARTTFVNARMAEMLGYTVEEMTGKGLFSLVMNKHSAEFGERKLETRRRGIKEMYEVEAIRKDGTPIYVSVCASPILDDEGQYAGSIAGVQDITERKKTESKSFEMQSLLSAIVESTRDFIWSVDPERFGLLTFNSRLRDTFLDTRGIHIKIGMTPEDLFPSPDFVDTWNDLYRRALLERRYTTEYVGKTGPHILELNFNLLKRDGSIVGISVFGKDITERKRAEEALEQHHRLLATTNALAIELASLPSREITEALMTKRLAEITGAAAVWFTEYDPDDRTLVLRHLEMETELLEKAARLLGKEPNEVRSPVSEDMYSEIVSNVIGKRQTLTEVSFGAIPPSVGTAIQELMGVDHFIGIAYVIEGELYGTSLLAMRAGRPDPAQELLESLAHMVAISLRQRRAEDALRQSEKKYRFMAENVSDVIWTIDMNLRPTYLSPSITRMTGYSVEETMARGMEKGLTPAAIEAISEIVMAEVARKGEPNSATRLTTVEVEMEHKDGSKIWADSAGTLLRGSDGQPVEIIGILRDITKRRQVLAALEKSEDRFRALAESGVDGILLVDSTGVISYGSPSMTAMLGYEEGSNDGRSMADFVHPDDLPEVVRLFGQLVANPGGMEHMELRVKHKSGSWRWADVVGSNLLHDHAVEAIVLNLRDIHDRKKAQDALAESEKKYRQLVETIHDGIWAIDKDSNTTFVNPRMAEMLGYTIEEMIGKHLFAFMDERGVEISKHNLERRQQGIEEQHDFEFLRKDGARVYTSLGTSAIIDDKGDYAGAIAGVQDITDRKRAEEALRESEAQYRTLFEAMPVVVVITTPEGKVVSVNNAIKGLSGYTPEEFMAMNMKDLYVDPGQRMRLLALLQKQGRVTDSEVMIRQKDGLNACALLNMDNLELRGQKLIMTTIRDITAIKQAEIKQRQTNEQLILASRLASLGLLASGVAHEINNPLAVVMGCAQLVLEKDPPEEVKEDLRLINDSAQQMAEVVQRLLTFGRQSKLGKECVDINVLVSRVLRLRAREMSIHNIEVTTRLDPDLPRTMADVGQMQQVFLNIILNAEQAMAKANKDGHFLVKTERTDDRITITFRDDGVGITKEYLPRLFDPFFTTKDVGEGMGLGLSISYGIVKEHNGSIYAKGQPGKGATFVVELPILAKPDQPESPEKPSEEPKEKVVGRILVVDDEPGICQLLRDLLTRDGHSVETVGDASVALEIVKHEQFNLILLDIKMKGMSGIDLYRQMGSIAESLQESVLFITGDTLAHDTRDFLDGTKAPHICKPFDIQQLRKMVNQILWSGRK